MADAATAPAPTSSSALEADGRDAAAKTNITEKPLDYREFYDEETKAKVAEVFAREIKLID